MDAIECYVSEPLQEPIKESDCEVCNYYSYLYEGDEDAYIQRLCYKGIEGVRIPEFDKCFVEMHKNDRSELSFCKTDLCNMNCAQNSSTSTSTEQPSSSSSSPSTPSSYSIILSTKLSSTTTTINNENGGNLTGNLLSVVGLLLISFFIMY
uniref:Uncharacterized protein n=1 Tax=Panagrolaimus davidi TaxID=227884 RepID=A0A914QV98_9BILA